VEGEVVRESDDRALGGPLFAVWQAPMDSKAPRNLSRCQPLTAFVSKAVFRSPVVNLHPYALQSGFFVKFRKKTHARHFAADAKTPAS
jgi:hypothetical protein